MSLANPIAAPRQDGLIWALVGVALGVAFLGGVLLSILVPAFAIVFLTVVAVSIAGVTLFVRWRASRQEMLLWALAIAAERGMPLASAFEVVPARSEEKQIILREMLKSGAPLPQALAVVPAALPRDVQILIHAGWSVGKLPEALREAAELRRARAPGRAALVARSAYLVFVLVVIQVVASFMLYFIIPKFEAIFQDFGVPLPRVTLFVIAASHFLVRATGPILAVVLLLEVAFLLILPVSLAGLWSWEVPLFDRLLKRKHAALVLRCLAWVVDGNRPLTSGLGLLAQFYPSTWVRVRLDHVHQDVAEGADCWDALEQRGLIRPTEKALFASARRAGNLAWALREAAESGERRASYRLQVGLQALGALVLVGLGLLVLVLTSAYFVPLITLIRRLEG